MGFRVSRATEAMRLDPSQGSQAHTLSARPKSPYCRKRLWW